MSSRFQRPFLKWPGNKFRCLSQLLDFFPTGKCLVEPFVGSGAVFLNTQYQSYHLNDINNDLIHLYRLLQAQGEDFIQYSRRYFTPKYNQADAYYRLRHRFNTCEPGWEKSALFLYLNRHGYNGLCRYNQSGVFNVPFGRYENPYFPEKEMRYFHEKAQRAVFKCQDFSYLMNKLEPPCIVYCDPPYHPLTSTANFTSYSKHEFVLKHQHKLAKLADTLAHRGIPVLISNHDTPVTRTVYNKANIQQFLVPRFISCNADSRKPVKEILACYGVS